MTKDEIIQTGIEILYEDETVMGDIRRAFGEEGITKMRLLEDEMEKKASQVDENLEDDAVFEELRRIKKELLRSLGI
ncbi:hypothetical protein KAU32_07980 [bacterium]|nr:hypothetical protein [bacterium]